MILVIGGIKGGSGKTTIATNLAQLRAENKKKVLLVDADEQQSAWDWSLQRYQTAPVDTVDFVTVCMTGKAVYSNLLKMKGDYDDIIVDTGGRDTTSQRASLACADKFLIPFKPRSIDIWTIGQVKRMITENSNMNLKSFAVISQADPKGKDNQDALDVLGECNELKCFPFFIGNRKSFCNASAEGLGVHELNPKDEKACKEISDLYNALYH